MYVFITKRLFELRKVNNITDKVTFDYNNLCPKRDRITIGLFSVQKSKTYDANIINIQKQIDYIKKIKLKFTEAARKAYRQPPEIIISVYLIPSWAISGQNFVSHYYEKAKQALLNDFRKIIGKDPIFNDRLVIIEDFYQKISLTQHEIGYLIGLEAKGSNADMIKTHAIICPENQKRRHLQMDSNTVISNYEDLYNQTFGKKNQIDALNASFYDVYYISAHNKIVYTARNGRIAPKLKTIHLYYCASHKNDHLLKDEKIIEEKKKKNSIYARDFTEALSQIGLTSKKIYFPDEGKPQSKTLYIALMNNKEYRITRNIVLAVNGSWGTQNAILEELKNLTPIILDDAECDYVCYANAVKKWSYDILDLDNAPDSDIEAEKNLESISNKQFEIRMIREFILSVFEKHPKESFRILQVFPSTPKGDDLVRILFANINNNLVSVKLLRNYGQDITNKANFENHLKMHTIYNVSSLMI